MRSSKAYADSIAENRILESLLSSVAKQDRDALAELYTRTKSSVYAMVLSYLKNADDAQDASHDVYIRIWDNASKYRADGKPMAWILTVAKNLALMRLRQNVREGELSDKEWSAIPAVQDSVTAEDKLLLQDALSVLGDEERRIVLLHAVSGLRHREIAGILDLALPTVLSKYSRAIRKMNLYAKGE